MGSKSMKIYVFTYTILPYSWKEKPPPGLKHKPGGGNTY